MAKIKLKKSLQVVLEKSKKAVIESIVQAMQQQTLAESQIAWLLLEFTLEYPFRPTLGLAQTSELEQFEDGDRHPLACYNAADLELFSEAQTIMVDFGAYDDLFETAEQLLEEIEYEDRQPFIFQLYVDICKALMLESPNWTHLNLAKDFHVTVRDYEVCDEALFLKKLLPKKVFNRIQRKIDAYEAKANDAYKNDETIIKVEAVMKQEASQYNALLATLALDACTDVFTQDEFYFLRPYAVEITMHKRPDEIEWELSTQLPTEWLAYYQYKLIDNVPQLVDFYSDGKLIWRKIFQHKQEETTSHKFFLKSGTPEIEDYAVLKEIASGILTYEEYMDGHYDEMRYEKNEQGQIVRATHVRSLFDIGYKTDATFEYFFDYKGHDLFKISCLNQNNQRSVSYCSDDSFMDEAIEAFVAHICKFTIAKMKERSLDNLGAVVLEYEYNLAFYFNIYLVCNKEMINISTYELYEDDSAMMNLTAYTSSSPTFPNQNYFSAEKSEAYVNKIYTQVSSVLAEKIQNNFQISVPVLCRAR